MLQPGENRLVIEVANTWLNRLIGNLTKLQDQSYTRSNGGTSAGPEQRPWREATPLPSGLMGPVQKKRNRLVYSERGAILQGGCLKFSRSYNRYFALINSKE